MRTQYNDRATHSPVRRRRGTPGFFIRLSLIVPVLVLMSVMPASSPRVAEAGCFQLASGFDQLIDHIEVCWIQSTGTFRAIIVRNDGIGTTGSCGCAPRVALSTSHVGLEDGSFSTPFQDTCGTAKNNTTVFDLTAFGRMVQVDVQYRVTGYLGGDNGSPIKWISAYSFVPQAVWDSPDQCMTVVE